jgi:hypothetical protein
MPDVLSGDFFCIKLKIIVAIGIWMQMIEEGVAAVGWRKYAAKEQRYERPHLSGGERIRYLLSMGMCSRRQPGSHA